MKTYRIKYNIRIFEDVGAHLLRWVALSVVTLGVAALFLPVLFCSVHGRADHD